MKRDASIPSEASSGRQPDEASGRLHDLLIAVKDIHHALLMTENEAELFQQTCNSLKQVSYVKFAWIGLAEKGTFDIKPVASAGFEDGYLSSIRVAWDDSEYGRGPTGTAIKTGQPFVMRDIAADPRYDHWRKEALKRGYASSVALPLIHEGEVIGALNVYSERKGAFGDQEVQFLSTVAEDVALGVRSLRLQRNLRESEAKYRALVEQSLQGIVIAQGSPLHLVFANPAMAKILGYTPDELTALSPKETEGLVHPEDRAVFFGRFSDRLQGKPAPSRYEVRGIRKDGETRWLDFYSKRIEYQGQPAVQAAFVDVTERKRMEDALRESEARLKDAQALGLIGSWEFDVESGKIAWSDQTYRLYERDPALGSPTAEEEATYYSPEQALRLREYARRAIAEGADFRYDLEADLPSGRHVFYSAMMQPIKDAHGRVVKLFGTVQDITERKLAEQKLRLQSEIVENMSEGVILTRPGDGVIVYANRRFEEMFGYVPGELIGKNVAAIDAPSMGRTPEDVAREIETSLNEHGVWSGEIRNIRKDGTLFWCRTDISTLESSEYGKIRVSINEDITESKRTAEKLDAIHKHSVRLSAANNIDEIVASTLDAMEYTLGFQYAGFEEVKDDFVQIKEARGIPASLEPLPLDGPGVVVKVARTKETIRISDTRSEPAFVDTTTKSPDGQPVRMLSELAVPVVVNGSVVAVLNVESAQLGAFTESDQVLLETLAMHVSSAISRLEQMEALRSRAEELGTLQATVLDITAPYDLSTLLERIVERAVRLLGAKSGGMYLCDPEKREARCVVSYNTPHDYRDVVLKYGEGAAGRVAETERPLIVNDYRLWEGRAEVYEKDSPFSALLSAPMIWQDRLVGIIHVMEESKARRFTQADLEMLMLFANHATIAVERTRTEEELRQYSLHLERLVNERTKELRSAKGRLEYVIGSNPAVIYTGKPLADGSDFVLTYLSERVSAMLGFEPSDFIGHPEFWERRVHQEDLRPTMARIPRLWKEGQYAFEYRFLHKDGTYRWIREEAKVVRDTDGKSIEVNGYWTDVSERKRLEEELVKAQRLATIGETAAMVGHDLRNPLQGIAGIVYLAKRDLESRKAADRKAAAALLDTIQEQIVYMDKIVSDLQDYSQLLTPKLTETDLPNLIRQTLSTINIPEAVKVTVEMEKSAKNAMIDPTLMRRTLTNLITNAIQVMPKRGKLTIRARTKRDSTVMTVEDTGSGIPRKNLAKLFSPFFTTKAKGQGLGLAVCKRLVEAQGGAITVKSKPRKGTTFTIKLPRGRKEVAR